MSYRRCKERDKRLKKLFKKTEHSYGAGVWYNEDKNRYIRYSCHNKWLKHHCRKTIRTRMKQEQRESDSIQLIGGKNNTYKKYYDYWWELL